MKHNSMKPFLFTILSPFLFLVLAAQGKDQPNVLFIAVDVLRDWVGHLDGHPNAKTPILTVLQNVEFPSPPAAESQTIIREFAEAWKKASGQ